MKILSPTRGGPDSFANQEKVIELAKARDAELIFLYVSNVRFLESLGHVAHAEIIESELDHMGEFLLAMAQERAEKAGWKAEAVVRSGDFWEALRSIIVEEDITTVILGSPGNTHAVTTKSFLGELMDSLAEEFNVEVLVLQDGEIIEHEKQG